MKNDNQGKKIKRVLTVGLHYEGAALEGVEFENLGLCWPLIDNARAAYPLYEYATIIVNPQSYTNFLFGSAGEHSDEVQELSNLKGQKDVYDIDTLFDGADRQNELTAAIAAGSTVVWCLAEPKRINFFWLP